MPELPEVETTCRGIAPHIEGQRICGMVVREHRLRWPIDNELPQLIRGQTLQAVTRRGKYLLLQLSQTTLIAHLGMSGSMRVLTPECGDHDDGEHALAPRKHDHYDIQFANDVILRYHDPRRFGCLLETTTPLEHPLIAILGPEPLSEAFNGAMLFAQSRGRTAPVKQFIMDSHTVVGVGNIYAAESLYRAGIHPLRAAGKVSLSRYEVLADAIKDILAYAISRGGTTLRDFVNSVGEPGYFAQELQVYGRIGQRCYQCNSPLKEARLAQRSSVYCPRCQR